MITQLTHTTTPRYSTKVWFHPSLLYDMSLHNW